MPLIPQSAANAAHAAFERFGWIRLQLSRRSVQSTLLWRPPGMLWRLMCNAWDQMELRLPACASRHLHQRRMSPALRRLAPGKHLPRRQIRSCIRLPVQVIHVQQHSHPQAGPGPQLHLSDAIDSSRLQEIPRCISIGRGAALIGSITQAGCWLTQHGGHSTGGTKKRTRDLPAL